MKRIAWEESQSPENGSRHCKMGMIPYVLLLGAILSQSPENGSRHCKGDSLCPCKRDCQGRVAIP